jgi:hypothetical protein
MVKKILIVSFLLAIVGCKFFVGEDEKLQSPCITNSSKALRLDGYYLEGDMRNDTTVTVFFLFNNGAISKVSSFYSHEFNHKERMLRDSSFYKDIGKSKGSWGVYHIDSNQIKIEMWQPGSGPYFRTFIESGQVLNDSTFLTNKLVGSGGEVKNFKEKTYRFKKLHPKPDSTNSFVCL